MLNPRWGGHVGLKRKDHFMLCEGREVCWESSGTSSSWGGFSPGYCSYTEVCSTCVHPQLAYLDDTVAMTVVLLLQSFGSDTLTWVLQGEPW